MAEPRDQSPGDHLLRLAERLLTPVMIVSPRAEILYVNPAAAEALGTSRRQLMSRSLLQIIHRDDRPTLRGALKRASAGERTANPFTYRVISTDRPLTFQAIADPIDYADIDGILLSAHDVTERVEHERELYSAAFTDSLTGLPNRAAVTQMLQELSDRTGVLGVAMIGLDRFKLINDSMGFTVGDSVLRAVAGRIAAVLPTAVIARFGADLFVVLLSGPAVAQARTLLWEVVARIAEPLFIDSRELTISASAGLAFQSQLATAETLLRNADLALHDAKARGGRRVARFVPRMRATALQRLELEADLRSALQRSEFRLAVQPIVRLTDNSHSRGEALIRWRRPGQPVSPSRLIRVAEETGLIVSIGEWVLERAAAMADGAPGGRLMVNLSARQLALPDIVGRIRGLIERSGTPTWRIGFEITETLLIEQFDYTVGVVNGLRELGCEVGLDDFGTGYSSLAYLRRLPIDFLKMDRSLIVDLSTSAEAQAIVNAIITMARALEIAVVAEGVETRTQAERLRDMGCPFAQGMFFGQPVLAA